jgi:hypothetical protein
MSRLASRVRHLEKRLGRCTVCAAWKARIVPQYGQPVPRPWHAANDLRTCPACGRVEETIVVWLHFLEPPPRDESGNEEKA